MDFYGTIGPACADVKLLQQMVEAGMTGIRMNLSHGPLAAHKDWLALLRTHSIQHGWFTWRSLTVSIFAGLAFLYYSCGIRTGLRRLRGQKQQG